MSKNQQPICIEICADSVEAALAAEAGGADRVELCANLLEGGTTPSAACLELTRQRLRIGLHVLVRPRGGDFCYADLEFEVIKRDILFAKSLGVDGMVAGVLLENGQIDKLRTAELIALTRPLSFTFHRAFDVAADPYQALRDLMALGVDRLLTSGQATTALEGAVLIAELIQMAEGRIIVMPGSGVNENTVQPLYQRTGAAEYHFSARKTLDSPMTYRNAKVSMGITQLPAEYARFTVDPERVQRVRQAIQIK